MYPRPSLTKAKMYVIDDKKPSLSLSSPFVSASKLEFPFNPKELKYKRGKPDFEASDKRPNSSQYTRLKSEGKGQLDEISFTMNFDDSAPSIDDPLDIAASLLPVTVANKALALVPAKSVMPPNLKPPISDCAAILHAWTLLIDPTDKTGLLRRPYLVCFEWGDMAFTGGISSLDIDFTLFDSDGTPMRAKAEVTITGRPGKHKWKTLLEPLSSSKSKSGSF
ncbi:MAG: hypothetical protein VX278_09670 [Myxococcota bacterium]|nr:hypothetical protein [Myxococcota bacterium]